MEVIEKEKNLYKVNKGEVIFNEGDPPLNIYLIKKGRVKIVKKTKNVENVIAILGTGEIFGEMGVITSSTRSATAVALEDTELYIIPENEIKNSIKDNIFLNLIVQSLVNRLRNTNDVLNFLTLNHEEQSLIFYLIIVYYMERRQEAKLKEIEYYTKISEENIKIYLSDLRVRGIVETGRDIVIIKKPNLLMEYAKYLFLREKFELRKKFPELEYIMKFSEF